MEDLNDSYAHLLRDGSELRRALGISDNGRYIVGTGWHAAQRREEAFLLDTAASEPVAPPEPPQLVAIWPVEGQTGKAAISWQPPRGVTYYRLESSLDPLFTVGVSRLEFPAGAYNLLVVNAPMSDGAVFYYRLQACNGAGCSAFVNAGLLARRVWPRENDWNVVVGAYRLLGWLTLWAQNGSPVEGKVCDLRLYEGLLGWGGVERKLCSSVPPGGTCQTTLETSSLFASASQAFPPYGEVGIGVFIP
jgi:hypothetical protein